MGKFFYGFFCALFFASVLLMTSCSRRSDKDVIMDMARSAARYAEEKDVKSIMALVSKDYRDNNGNDRDAIKGIFVYQLLRPGKVKVLIRSMGVEVREGKAVLEARVVLARAGVGSGISGAVPENADVLKLNVVFRKEDGAWKAASSEWGSIGAAGLL